MFFMSFLKVWLESSSTVEFCLSKMEQETKQIPISSQVISYQDSSDLDSLYSASAPATDLL